jgi:hypothetical protein
VKYSVIILATVVIAPTFLRAAPETDAEPHAVELAYRTPEQITAAARATAQQTMLSPEEEKRLLAIIPPGGAVDVTLYDTVIGSANPKWLTYIITNSEGHVLARTEGTSRVSDGKEGWRWVGYDRVSLPAFTDSLQIRVYHGVWGILGDFVISRSGSVQRGQLKVTVTLRQAISLQMQGSTITLPVGTKLEVVSRDSNEVRVRYMGTEHFVPISATDMQ